MHYILDTLAISFSLPTLVTVLIYNLICAFVYPGITAARPQGVSWTPVPDKLKYVSCGALGCWGVNSNDDIFYRSGVSRSNCAGTGWRQIPGKLKQIEVLYIYL